MDHTLLMDSDFVVGNGFVSSGVEMGSSESPRSADQVPTRELELNPHGLLKFGANWLRSGKRGHPAATYMGWGDPFRGS